MNYTSTIPIFLLLVPLLAGVLCMLMQRRMWWERVNLAAFAIVAALAIRLGLDVAQHDKVSALEGFLRADGLSALVTGLTAFVALVCGVYAVGYFRRDLRDGRINGEQLRHHYVLQQRFV